MSKLTEMVRLEDLAAEYQRIIGNRMEIGLNASIDMLNPKEQGYMLATRQPYKISNIKAESLQIVLRFYVCCENKKDYDDTIHILGLLAGLCKGTFTSVSKKFRYFSFLDFSRPLSEPEVNCGKFYQTLELMGTCLVTQTAGGVLIGNEVKTYFQMGSGDGSTINSEMEVLSANTTLTKTQEAPQMANETVAKTFNNTQLFSYSYTLLIMKNKICERIIKGIENILPFGLNEKVTIIEEYPSFSDDEKETFTKEKEVVITGGSLERNAGAFVLATISFQDRYEFADNDEKDEEESYNTSTLINDYRAATTQSTS